MTGGRVFTRAVVALLLATGLSAAPKAAPLTSDGAGAHGFGLGGVSQAVALRRAADALAERFAARAEYGGLLVAESALRDGLPGDAALRRLLAAAHAAAGDVAAARDLLSAATPEGVDVWGAVARSLLARRAGDLDAAAAQAAAAIAADPDNAYARNAAGAAAAEAGDLEAAVSHFAAAVERGPEGAPYFANLGATLAALGDAGHATVALRRALELAPEDCVALIAAAGLAPREAPELLGRCLAAQPGHPQAAPRFVDALLAREAFDEALNAVDAHAAGFDDPERVRARIALHAGDAAAAQARLAAAHPSSETALLAAYAAAMAGDPASGAAIAAEAVADTDVVDAAARAALGFAAAAGLPPDPATADRFGDAPAARFFAALGAPGAPDFAGADGVSAGLRFAGLESAGADEAASRAPLALGVVWRDAGMAGPARKAFAAAVAAAPQSALAQLLLGLSLVEASPPDRDGALRAYDAALSLAPRFAAAHRAKAELLARTGDLGAARLHLGAALDVEDDALGRLNEGAMAEAIGDDAAARAAYERAVALAPDFFAALNQLAWHLAEREIELDRAQALAERAAAQRPGNASVLDTLGWIRFLQGDATGALTALRQAHEADEGRRPEITLRLAQAEVAAGDPTRADALLREVASGEGATAETAQKMLRER
ncbi:MAG: hypothetical protein EA355_13680, partial [Rhodobacteraceae bacterium]